ncbi:hypothetical protein [Desertibaculum subflavum]|uniref:hypothetical protein n=1 Tax=Desertibaculum subflavum TaxID=2268458 RepID=UPI000E66FB1C
MADTAKPIKQLYDEGMAEVFRVVGSLDATDDQVKLAKQTAKDLSSMLVAHTLQTIEGRTALLAGLIVELRQVIDSVQTSPPLAKTLTNLTTILGKAQTLFAKEKKGLV